MPIQYTIVATRILSDGSVELSLTANSGNGASSLTLPAGSPLIAQAYVGRTVQATWALL